MGDEKKKESNPATAREVIAAHVAALEDLCPSCRGRTEPEVGSGCAKTWAPEWSREHAPAFPVVVLPVDVLCAFCGAAGTRDPEAMRAHVVACEKHPFHAMAKERDALRAEVAALKAERTAADGAAAKWEALREAAAKVSADWKKTSVMVPTQADFDRLDAALTALASAPAPSAPLAGVAVARRGEEVEVGTLALGALFEWDARRWCVYATSEARQNLRAVTLGGACFRVFDVERVRPLTLTLAEGPGEATAEAIVHACNESAAIDLIAAVTETGEETVREAVGRVGLPQVATNAENVARKLRAERARLAADLAAAEKARDAERDANRDERGVWSRTMHAIGAIDTPQSGYPVASIEREVVALKARAEKAEAGGRELVAHNTRYFDAAREAQAALAAERTAHERTRAKLRAWEEKTRPLCTHNNLVLRCSVCEDRSAAVELRQIAEAAALKADRDAEKARADKAEARLAALDGPKQQACGHPWRRVREVEEGVSYECMECTLAAERTAHEQTRAALKASRTDDIWGRYVAAHAAIDAIPGAPPKENPDGVSVARSVADRVNLLGDALAAATKRAEAAETGLAAAQQRVAALEGAARTLVTSNRYVVLSKWTDENDPDSPRVTVDCEEVAALKRLVNVPVKGDLGPAPAQPAKAAEIHPEHRTLLYDHAAAKDALATAGLPQAYWLRGDASMPGAVKELIAMLKPARQSGDEGVRAAAAEHVKSLALWFDREPIEKIAAKPGWYAHGYHMLAKTGLALRAALAATPEKETTK